MTELNLSQTSGAPGNASTTSKPSRGAGRITLAVVLSFLIPGLGQVYARKPLRGLLFAIATTCFSFLTAEFHVLLTFGGLIADFAIRILLAVVTTVDAGYFASAKRWAKSTEARPATLLTISALLLTLLLGAYPIPQLILKQAKIDFGAFRVPSASMCPTICEGDRIVANRNAYANSSPRRGDLIMMKQASFEALLIKRVIGVEGDSVTQTEGRIFVNGQPLAKPVYRPGCGATDTQSPNLDPILFQPVKVSPHSLFVVGDNLPNSFDSRTPEFGGVDISQVRGRPLFLYWSWTRSRIGCELH